MSVLSTIQAELKNLFRFNKSNRSWHVPFMAAFCIGMPLLTGYFTNHFQDGVFACLGGLLIVYLPARGSVTYRLMTVLLCALGFVFSMAFGLLIAFNALFSVIAFGIFTIVLHWVMLNYKAAPPRSFFFVLIVSMSSCMPFQPALIPEKVGLIALSTIFTCIVAIVYTMYRSFKGLIKDEDMVTDQSKSFSADSWEAVIFGFFMFLALGIGKLFEFSNPYWIAISCAAVMQGASLYHIWQRTFHRVLGTFIGLGLAWVVVQVISTPLQMIAAMLCLQFIIEMLITRKYVWAVMFITPFTILLSEASRMGAVDVNTLISLRFYEIAIGSILGAFGGWVLHKEKVRHSGIGTIKQLSSGLRKKFMSEAYE